MDNAKYTNQQPIDIETRLGTHNYHPLDVVLTCGEECRRTFAPADAGPPRVDIKM